MDVMIGLGLVYILLCWFLAKNISKKNKSSNRIYWIAIFISSIVVVLGCITPFNFRYGFAIAYIIVFVGWIVQKGISKKIDIAV